MNNPPTPLSASYSTQTVPHDAFGGLFTYFWW